MRKQIKEKPALTLVDSPHFIDSLEIIHKRKGKVIDHREVTFDLVTNIGKAALAGLINGVVTTPFKYVAIGTGTTAANVADTTLEAEITTGGGARALGTCTQVTTTVTNDTAQIEVTYTFTAGFAITESGFLDSVSNGVLGGRQVFGAYIVVATDEVIFRWKVKAA